MALYTLAPQPWLVFLDDGGLYIPNGQLAIYAAGTSTPATVYTSATGTAHPFPITLDGTGRVPSGLYLQPGLSYKFVLHAPQSDEPLDGAIIRTQDNVAATPLAGGAVMVISAPGDYNNLNVAGVRIIEYTGAGALRIRGMVGGVPGQSLLIVNTTEPLTGEVWVYSSDATAPSGASLFNLFNIGPTPILGQRGSAEFIYLSRGGTPVWKMVTFEQGRPILPPFNAANYSGSGSMTWTVEAADVIHEGFYIRGRTLLYTFEIRDTTIGGTVNTALQRLLPFGWQRLYQTTYSTAMTTRVSGGSFEGGLASMGNDTVVVFQRGPTLGSNWIAGANNASVLGQMEIVLS